MASSGDGSDTSVDRSMALRKRGGIWYFRKMINGQLFRESTGFADRKAAERRANEIELDIRAGVHGWKSTIPSSITADTALRLARLFAMTPYFWMNLQTAYDLDVATRASADRIRRDVHPRGAV